MKNESFEEFKDEQQIVRTTFWSLKTKMDFM